MLQLIPYRSARDLPQADKDMWPVLPAITEDTTMDIYTEAGMLIIEITLPAFNKEEVTVSTDLDDVEVTAEHQEKKEKEHRRSYILHESNRSYHRRIQLPVGANTDEAIASFLDGTLYITMPFNRQNERKEVHIT